MRGQSPWTEATITELTQLWSEGRSGAEISRRLNVSKNSVIGKAHRLDLPGRPSPIRYIGEERKQRTKAARHNIALAQLSTLPSLRTATALPNSTPTQTRPSQPGEKSATFKADRCCWPIGDPGSSSFRFCGESALPGKPYCQEHANRAYLKKQINIAERKFAIHAAPFADS
jgi:GcrA cell cycle regulator